MSKKLCARLTGTVARKSADNFYNEFLLTNTHMCEYHFKELKEIYNYAPMDDWPKKLQTDDSGKEIDTLFSLVCFRKPVSSTGQPQKLSKRFQNAYNKACELFHNTFDNDVDKNCIDVAMCHFPTMAIFMAQKTDVKKKKNQRKSVLDVAKPDLQLHCLAAVNYFMDGHHTQVLWLATTMEEPPEDSIHVVWQGCGMATYLLCLLVKQHTGINGSMENSILSLQASSDRHHANSQFYLKVGFICHKGLEDNGLSQTSKGFQAAVEKFPEIWVKHDAQLMPFFQLYQGRLKFNAKKNLSLNNSATDWKNYVYARFPCSHMSMMKIEGYFNPYPTFQCLSGNPLPLTDRPLLSTRSVSKMSGMINGEIRQKLDTRSWLVTGEIEFILSLLLRRHSRNRSMHILGPHICNVVGDVYGCFGHIWDKTATEEQVQFYNLHLRRMYEYIDTRLDILEHKFLVFICNINVTHWVAVVVVNPFLVSDGFIHEQEDKGVTIPEDEDFVGWCVLNSNNRAKEKETNGFQGTVFTKNRPSFGVRLFLNICASYLKARNKNQGNPTWDKVTYEEPFGQYDNPDGCQNFPRFDYDFPTIIRQSNGFDCGLASVANCMAFLKHSLPIKFRKEYMCGYKTDSDEAKKEHFLLNEKHYSLKPFWDNLFENIRKKYAKKIMQSPRCLGLHATRVHCYC